MKNSTLAIYNINKNMQQSLKQQELNAIKAHQYLYYVKGTPIISDYNYDHLCKKHNVFGGGGSDRAEDYPKEIQELAIEMYDERYW
jgi:hypothetical protein